MCRRSVVMGMILVVWGGRLALSAREKAKAQWSYGRKFRWPVAARVIREGNGQVLAFLNLGGRA